MTAEQFAYWLNGFAELNHAAPTKEQWQSIREHLALVFNKKTPPIAMPKVDLSGNKEVMDLIEKAKQERGYQPWPPTPLSPYWLDQNIKPGTLMC